MICSSVVYIRLCNTVLRGVCMLAMRTVTPLQERSLVVPTCGLPTAAGLGLPAVPVQGTSRAAHRAGLQL